MAINPGRGVSDACGGVAGGGATVREMIGLLGLHHELRYAHDERNCPRLLGWDPAGLKARIILDFELSLIATIRYWERRVRE